MNEHNYTTKKPTKSNPPFYFIEGKGWYIDTKVKTPQGFKHLKKGYFPTLQVARNEFPVLSAKLSGEIEDRSTVTWEKFCDAYLQYRRTQVKGSSIAQDKIRYRFLTSVMGAETPVGDCFKRSKAAAIQSAVLCLEMAIPGKNKIIALYRNMAEFAYERDFMESDRDLKAVRSETAKIVAREENTEHHIERWVLSYEEEKALLDAIVNPVDKLLVLTLFETGLRFGEAIALTPLDFDPLKSEISVTKTVSVDENGKRRVFNRTKTALGKRRIPVSTDFMNTVAAYVKTMGIPQDGLLFPPCTSEADVLDGTAFRRRLGQYCDKAGIRRASPHCFRHTYATRLSQRCYTDADRQARAYVLGHSVTVDEQVYTAHNQLETARSLLK